MTSERDKCSFISSILPISCRDHAEAFARTLQSRLNSLGTHEDDDDDDDDDQRDDEKTWLAQHENSLSLSQPSRQTECYNNLALENCLFDESSSLCSPQEEIEDPIEKIFHCNGLVRNQSSVDSENEIFYDLEDENDQDEDDNDDLLNNPSHISAESESLCLNDSSSGSSSAEIFATSLDCTPQDDTVNEFSDTNGKIDDEKEDYNDDDEPTPRIRRCSSLKSGKTPPGTPGRKKIVRFADVLGLDLADVRTFLDEVPKIPKSAYNDLSDVDLSSSLIITSNCVKNKPDRILLPLFEQPSGSLNFLDLVNDHKVCLENALVEDPILFLIKGTVRVRNLDFHKSVHLRYTLDNWRNFADVQAVYLNNSCDGFSDRFAFTIYAHTLQIGQKLQFACRFQCKGQQYWDNNNGKNYCFQCLPSNNSSSSSSTVLLNNEPSSADWSASFY